MTTLDELKDRAGALLDGELGAELLALSADLHAHPEIRFEEHHAAAAIADLLRRHGLAPATGVAGLPTALEARLRGGNTGPSVAILAEYDALPGLGHACGHNVIAAAGVGAFLALAKLGSLPGLTRLLGTPGEEGGGGKVIMAEAGLFDGVDAAMMIHPYDRTHTDVQLAGRVPLRVVFKGRAAHAAAAPEHGINALDAAIQLFNGIAALRQHLPAETRIHGIIAEGGEAPNIVPERARAEVYVRAYDQAILDRLVAQVRACAEGAALQTGCTVEVTLAAPAYDAMATNAPLAARFAANLDRIGHPREPAASRTMASTDLGNVATRLPVIHPYLGMGAGLVCHTPEFALAAGDDRGRRLVIDGAKALAMTALDLLLDPDLAAAVAAAHAKGAA